MSKSHRKRAFLPEKAAFEQAIAKMKKQGFKPTPSFNPFWDRGGVTFEDHEGYRVVFFNGSWAM